MDRNKTLSTVLSHSLGKLNASLQNLSASLADCKPGERADVTG
jgi:hypothetical protein